MSLAPALLAALTLLAAQVPRETASVGLPRRLHDVVLPAPELEVGPITLETPVILRILDVRPHGDAFRYDLEFYGLDPGTYDLASFLVRRDGLPTEGLPEVPVQVTSILPPGQVKPNPLEPGGAPGLGGYRATLWVGGVLWVLGLVAILFFRRRRAAESSATPGRGTTLAERLRPLVERARAGTLTGGERAELELALIAYWRRRLDLRDTPTAAAVAELRRHPEAGPLLVRLEEWLHRPPAEGAAGAAASADPGDVAELLAPYRDLPADALDMPASPAPPAARQPVA